MTDKDLAELNQKTGMQWTRKGKTTVFAPVAGERRVECQVLHTQYYSYVWSVWDDNVQAWCLTSDTIEKGIAALRAHATREAQRWADTQLALTPLT